ncbi:MAG TPA: DUF2911 domain-containing protein [Chitinophagaceae bacterium]|jgi:hypothetical protein|nr:DUF2911 domain-containing protein [Chitinophagaceae bacterium]
MKTLLKLATLATVLMLATTTHAQTDKSTRPSPPALAKQKVGDVIITIDYSQPSIKGRTIGKDLEPMDGQVWRTGANEATIFEVDKDVTVEGKSLEEGKYGLFTIVNGDDWTIIFNKNWNQWGAFSYKSDDDVLRVNVKATKADPYAEKFTINISEAGVVTLLWGDRKVEFTVK